MKHRITIELFTLREAYERYGFLITTLQAAIRRGALPAMKVGTGTTACYLIQRADLETFNPQKRGRPARKEGAKK